MPIQTSHLNSRIFTRAVFLVSSFFLFPTSLFADWAGAVKKPSTIEKSGKTFYEIETPENLAWFATQVNKGNTSYNAILKNNIAIIDSSITENSINWTPIGSDSTENTRYKGVFDGNGFTISGIYSKADYAGLFGVVDSGAVIKNLSVENIRLKSNGKSSVGERRPVGGIANVFGGDSLLNCTFNAKSVFIDSASFGGLVGLLNSPNAIIDNALSQGTFVRGSEISPSFYIGMAGIAAVVRSSKLKVRNSKNYTFSEVGSGKTSNYRGVHDAGFIYKVTNSDVSFENSENNASIDSVLADISGFVKLASSSKISFLNSSNNGSFTTYDGLASGFVTTCSNKGTLIFESSYNNGNIASRKTSDSGYLSYATIAGGFVGSNAGCSMHFENSVNDGEINAGHAGGFVGENRTKIDFYDCINRGKITSINSSYYSPLAGGFIAYDSSQTLTMKNNYNEGLISGYFAGGFISQRDGKGLANIEAIHNKEKISGRFYAGGIAAIFSADDSLSTIKSSQNEAEVESIRANFVGGIFGKSTGIHIEGVRNLGTINGFMWNPSNHYNAAGGIVGVFQGYASRIMNSVNEGNIVITKKDTVRNELAAVGGIVGLWAADHGYTTSEIYPEMRYCENKGTIEATSDPDTVHSLQPSDEFSIGGIIGLVGHLSGTNYTLAAPGYISNNVNSGAIKTTLNHASNECTGGIVGYWYKTSTLSSSPLGLLANLNKGNVISRRSANGIMGCTFVNPSSGSLSIADSITNGTNRKALQNNCLFYDKDLLGYEFDSLGTGISTTNAQTESFAWMLNTCGGTLENTGYWSKHGKNYPIFADKDNHAIYKVTFWDSSKVINVNKYEIGESFTDYTGKIIDMPNDPDPSDADEDMMFGYWTYGTQVIDSKSIINGDYNLYANYVQKNSTIETLVFKTESDAVITEFVITDKTAEITLPDAPIKTGYNFVGWYYGNQLIGQPGEQFVPGTITTLIAKYEVILYKISFISGMDTLQTNNLTYGEMPEYKEKIPVCEVASYQFVGWTPDIEPVTSEKMYYATCGRSSAESSSSIATSSSSIVSSSSISVSSSSSNTQESSSSVTLSSSSEEHPVVVRSTLRKPFVLTTNGLTITMSEIQGHSVRIFDSLGHLIAVKSFNGNFTSITLPAPGNYIIKAGKISRNVILK